MANDFSGDVNCVALWKFDNNALDSIGGNDLAPPFDSPTYDGSVKKEGTHAANFVAASEQCFRINDADLDAGFPGKSGTSEQSFSIVGWFRPASLGIISTIISKYQLSNDIRSYKVNIGSATDKLTFSIGHTNGTDYTTLSFGVACAADIWYHFGVTYNAATNAMKIRVWDDNAGALLDSNATETSGADMSPTTCLLAVGEYNWSGTTCFDGKIDEIVFFNDVLTDDEIDAIRAGTYAEGAGAGMSSIHSSLAAVGVI